MCDRNEKKNVVPRWVISISQTFTKHVDHGHGTQTCIEKNSFDKEKIACFKFRIPNNSCNQQQQPKTAQTMKCETCQRFFFRWFIIIIFFFVLLFYFSLSMFRRYDDDDDDDDGVYGRTNFFFVFVSCLNIFNMQIAYVLLDIQYMVISYSYLPETILPNVE